MSLEVWCTLISRTPLRLFLQRREPLFTSQLQWAERNSLSTLHTASQGWALVSPPLPRPQPTLERHSFSRQNKRLLIAGAFCLLSKMNQTLYKLGFNSVGYAVSPHHIPFILPPPSPHPRPCITRIPFTRSSAPAGGCLGWPDGPDALGQSLLDAQWPQLMKAVRDRRQPFLENWVS